MKYYFTLLILLVTSIAAIAQERKKISEEEFNKHYADRFEIVGENIEIQRVFQFSDIDKEELYRRAKAYLDDRIQKKYEGKTDDASKMRQAQEMQNLYKKYNINPLGTLLTAFIQFPIIIAIYQSVQRSAAVATGSMDIFGNVIHFEMTPWEGIMSGQFIYLIVFLIMAVLYFLSMQIPMLITKQKAKKEAEKHHRKPEDTKNPMGNMMYYMMIPILVLSIMWPTGMTIYWIISSLVIILRTLLVQYVFIDKLQNKDKAGK